MKTKVFVEDLLASMSIEQKIGQMTQTERLVITPEEVKKYHIGSVLSGGGSCPPGNRPCDWVKMVDAFWEASMESETGIPLLYGVDAIHGNNNVTGATVFPHNIGLGAANDPELLQRIARVTATEVLSAGVDWTFAPTLAVARDICWGRTYESYACYPERVSAYAGEFVKGLQHDLGEDGVIACAKHWVGDGGTRYGMDQGETTISFPELQSVHMAPYLPALEAGVLTVMVSFNSWNGDKCHGHHYLITEILKEKLGFDGLVLSDWDGIDYLAEDYSEAIEISVNAGIDLFMISEKWEEFIDRLLLLVRDGKVAASRIDDAVRRILQVKYKFGLFSKPRPSQRKWSDHPDFGGVAHRKVAREAVGKSLVVLKNENGLLPLDRRQKILVAGKFADDAGAQCGGFTLSWQGESGADPVPGATSIWEAVQQEAPEAELTLDPDATHADRSRHDVAIVVVGEYPYAEGLGDIRADDNLAVEIGSQIKCDIKVLEPYGRTLVLADHHPEDIEVMARIAVEGIPMVVVLLSGRPLIVDRELALADSFVAAWLPGSEGAGVTDVLFGRQPATGALAFDWPAAQGSRFSRDYGLGFDHQSDM